MITPNMQEARECAEAFKEVYPKANLEYWSKYILIYLEEAEARGRLEGLEEGAKVAENFKVRTATDEMVGIIRASGAGIASAIRQRSKEEGSKTLTRQSEKEK